MADKKTTAIDDEKNNAIANELSSEEIDEVSAGAGTHESKRDAEADDNVTDTDIDDVPDSAEETPYQAKHMTPHDADGTMSEPDSDDADNVVPAPVSDTADNENTDVSGSDECESGASESATEDDAAPVSDTDIKEQNKKLKRNMRIQSIKRHKRLIILAVIAVSAFAIGYFIMSGGYQSLVDSLPTGSGQTDSEETNPNDGVAATIDGSYEVTEEQVNGYIAQYRTYNGLTSDEDWSEYLESIGKTAEDVRSDSIDYYATRYAVEKECEKDGISVSDDEVTKELERVKAEYGITDEDTYQDFLDSMGYTDETYKSDIKYNLLQDKLVAANVTPSEPTDAQLESVAERTPTKFTGRKSYNIVFIADTNDSASMKSARAAAQRCIDELNGMGDVTVDDFAAVGDEFVSDGAAQQSSAVTWDGTVSLDDCVELSRIFEEKFDRETEDYSLTVGSAGLDQPFKVLRQYEKAVGTVVQALLRDGRKLKGVLTGASGDGITLKYEVREAVEGEKRKKMVEHEDFFPMDMINAVFPVVEIG